MSLTPGKLCALVCCDLASWSHFLDNLSLALYLQNNEWMNGWMGKGLSHLHCVEMERIQDLRWTRHSRTRDWRHRGLWRLVWSQAGTSPTEAGETILIKWWMALYWVDDRVPGRDVQQDSSITQGTDGSSRWLGEWVSFNFRPVPRN